MKRNRTTLSAFVALFSTFAIFSTFEIFAQEETSDGIPEAVKNWVDSPDTTLRLWPGTPPGGVPEGIGDEEWIPGKETPPIVRVGRISIPTLALYKAEKPNGSCVVIFPGGGYSILAYNHEGTEIARWLNGIGVSAVVVKYRVPRRDGLEKHFAPLQDAQRAIRLVRGNATRWGIDPNRIGVLGFSAGGHLTIMAATQYKTKVYDATDEFDQIDCRPNFAIPIYPAYMMDDENEKNADVPLSDLVAIDSNTPPTFVSVADRDANRAAASARLFLKLYEAGVPAELHIVRGTAHGYGIRSNSGRPAEWNLSCERWMKESGLLDAETK